MKGTASTPTTGPEVRVLGVVSSLAELGPEGLTQAERVAAVSALESLKGAAAAAQARLTAAAVVDREALGEDSRSVRAEIALARRCSPSVADQHVGVARALVFELPCTMRALERGEISERRAVIVVRETACLSVEHRGEVDRRLAPVIGSLGDRAVAAAARRAGAALDAESLAERARRAVASRRVSVRPAADGMAWLSVLGPLKDVIGAHLALVREEGRRHVIDPDLPQEQWDAAAAAARADTRGKGAWLADRALELLSGRAKGQPQPVEVSLVMTDRVLLPAAFGGAVPEDDCATIPGWGPIAGADVRSHIAALLDTDAGCLVDSGPRGVTDVGSREDSRSRGGADVGSREDSRSHVDPDANSPVDSGCHGGADAGSRDDSRSHDGADAGAFVWLRRLFTDPTGRDLVALDSRRRRFHGGLRRFLELRDPTCRIPWCDAPATQSDHTRSHAEGGPTDAGNGAGLCQRHNLVKELDGWHVRVESTGLDGTGAHGIRIQSPTGRVHDSTAPPILGEGWLEPTPDVHLQDLPMPEDPWEGWIPDPPEDWLTRDELQVA